MEKLLKKQICIIGAGFAGKAIARELKEKSITGNVVCFIDDDPAKIGNLIDGIPVQGPISRVQQIIHDHPVDEILICIPSATREELHTIYDKLKTAPCQSLSILPSLTQIIDGQAHLVQTRSLAPQDLLGRTPIRINLKESLSYIRGKRVLVSGAGGSIGSELCRQLLSGGAERLYLFGHGENSIFHVQQELLRLQEGGVGEKAVIVPVIGELKDQDYIRFLCKRLRADVIFHCAAHKHVSLMEANPIEAIVNNVFGTYHLLNSAREFNVSRFIFISTDKAVNPNSIYGVSKLLSERLVLEAGKSSKNYMVLRFGNVLGSRGSIVPIFKQQIQSGGPITLTHPEVERYFMTIPEAVSLVLKAGGIEKNSSLYILDMGDPVKIKDIAWQMARFYNLEPDKDIGIKIIGLRPGEKIREKLWSEDEIPVESGYAGILQIKRKQDWQNNLETLIQNLRPLCFFDPAQADLYRNRRKLRSLLRDAVPSLPHKDDEPEY